MASWPDRDQSVEERSTRRCDNLKEYRSMSASLEEHVASWPDRDQSVKERSVRRCDNLKEYRSMSGSLE